MFYLDFAAYTLGSCYHTGTNGFKQDSKRALKHLTKAKDLARKRGNDCVLTESDLSKIEQYLCLYDKSKDEAKSQTGSSQSGIDGSENPPCRTVEPSENDTTISTLTPPSKGNS